MSEDATRNANVNLTANVDGYRQSTQGATQDTNTLIASVDALASKLDGLQRRVSKRMTLFAAADLAMMTSMVAVTGSYEKQLTSLSAQSAIAGKSVGLISNSIRQMTRDMPVARGEIAATATAISKMGVTSQRDIAGLTETFTKTAAAAGESAVAIGSSMTMLSRQMGTLAGGAQQMQKYTDSLLSVSAAAGVSAQSVADFANSIAPISAAAGISQTQVLGLSAAFVQAGNDGYAAATTFNKMLSDIVTTTSQGGPGLGKYAALLGVTVEQFKGMPAADKITGIFKAINSAGPQSISILDQMGYDGIRATKAIQTMAAQAGGLEKLVQTATGSYGNDATNTGASAAMSGLNDQMQRFGNLAQDMATSIGAGIITPLTGGLSVLNTILAQGAKLTGVFSAGGALAGVGGLAMGGAGIAGTIASYAALPVALRWLWNSKPMGAFRAGRQAGMGNMDLQKGGYADRYTSGEAGRLESAAFGGGWRVGEHTTPGSAGPGMLGRVVGAPFRIGSLFADSFRKYYNESGVPGNLRSSGDLENILGLKKGALQAEITAHRSLTESVLKAAAATGKLTLAEAKAGVGAVAAGAAPALRGLGSSALSFIGGPIGLAVMGATAAASIKGVNDSRMDEIKSMSPADMTIATSYNSALGIATTALTGLSDTVSTTTAAVKDLADAANQAKTSGLKSLINPNAASVSNVAQGVAYLKSVGSTNPAVMKGAMQDVRSALGPTLGNQAIDAFMGSGNKGADLSSITTLGSGIDSGNSNGPLDWLNARTGLVSTTMDKSTITNMISSANAYVSGVEGKYGAKAGQQARMLAIQKILDALGQTTNYAARQEGFHQLEQFAGANFKIGVTDSNANKGSWSGADFLKQYGGADSGLPQGLPLGAAGQKALAGLETTQTAPAVAALTKMGYNPDTSAFAGVNPVTGSPSDPTKQAAAIQYAYAIAQKNATRQVARARAALAKKLGLKVTDPRVVNAITVADYMGQNLQNVAGVEGVTSDSIYSGQLAATQSAQSLVANDQALQGVTQTRVQKLTSSRTRMGLAQQAYQDTSNVDPNKYQNFISAQASYKQQVAGYTQYLQQMVQAQEQFQLQSKRSDEDYKLQMGYSAADFYKGQRRSREDFNLSMSRQLQDTAKTIYNPMIRVQSQYTTDVGTLKQNMSEQTRMIKQQVANLRKLKRLGLSQSTIDMLQLADPANAQQVEELTQEMTKTDAATLNKQASQRQSATKSLTQSDLNQGYTRAVADFNKSVSRSVADYKTGVDRMAQAHKTQLARAKEDLALMSKEYVGDFTTMFNKAQALVKSNLGKTANLTMDELNAIKTAFPEFFTSLPTPKGLSPGARGGARAAGVSAHAAHVAHTTHVSHTTHTTQHNVTINGGVTIPSVKPADTAKVLADVARMKKLKHV